MSNPGCTNNNIAPIIPARDIGEVYDNFDPTLPVDPASEQYIPRVDQGLMKLVLALNRAKSPLHGFICGHRGSGKTTELNKLCADESICSKYLPIYLTAQDFGAESINLTHDALLVELGLSLVKEAKKHGFGEQYEEELDKWGRSVVEKFLSSESVVAEAGAKANWWVLYIKSFLSFKEERSKEEKKDMAPKIADLIDILDRMAQDIKNKTQKQVLFVIDDLEKGDSDAEKKMHSRLFQDNYDSLVRPQMSIIYTLPIYYLSDKGRRIPSEQIYSFSAIHVFDREDKKSRAPRLNKDHEGYKIMRHFIESRVADHNALFEDGTIDELILIGAGLFRETARAVREAAANTLISGRAKITAEDVKNSFNSIRKDYQPKIRGDALRILREVYESEDGWPEGVEPFLQDRAVVEYENGKRWLDVRYVLKDYVIDNVLKLSDATKG